MDARATDEIVGYALRLRGVRVQSHMGVTQAERDTAQELVVSVDVELGADGYPSRDEPATVADYAEIVRAADECARQQPDRLLETFALRVARRLMKRWSEAELVRVSVTKARVPVAPPADEATVEVTLGRAAS